MDVEPTKRDGGSHRGRSRGPGARDQGAKLLVVSTRGVNWTARSKLDCLSLRVYKIPSSTVYEWLS